MKKTIGIFVFSLFIGVIFWACNQKTQYDTTYGSDFQECRQFLPMQVGATQLFRLDSAAPTAFGQSLAVHSYLLKDSVARQLTDATNDTVFEVYRFITDTLQEQPWNLQGTYRIVYTPKTVDLIEDDSTLRFIKLAYPVVNGYNWDGNRYFTTPGIGSNTDVYYAYEGWNYIYDSVGMPYTTVYGATFPNSVIVNEVNNVLGNTGDFNSNLFQQVKYSQEVYAQNVGLIYQNTLFYIYQPTGATMGYDPRSFGVTITRLQ